MKTFQVNNLLDDFFSVVLKNAFRRLESPSVSDSVNSVTINFHKIRSVSKEIPSEVKVSVVKMIVIMWDDCNFRIISFPEPMVGL